MSRKSITSSAFFSKVDISGIFINHLGTLKNYGSSSYSAADILVFFILPGIFSIAIVYGGLRLNQNLISILINVFAIFASFLFGLLILIYDVVSKTVKDSNTLAENRLALNRLEAIAFNVSFEVLLSILTVLLLLISVAFDKGVLSIISSLVVIYLVAVFTLTLFMILKRVHKLLDEEIQHQRKLLK